MAYSKFTLTQVLEAFDLVTDDTRDLFPDVMPVEPSALLRETLEQNVAVARRIATEKARSELIVAPILMEAYRRNQPEIGFFSGVDFTVDDKQGLSGVCDFLFTRSREHAVIVSPVLAVVEAKKEDLKPGLGQCIAELVAARIFNERKGKIIPEVYGVVTTGTNWQFLKLSGQTVFLDREERYLNGASRILGILFEILRGEV
ncbi:hypothetical protein [Armatimonas sp.]|uniref:hypothetical protein n=1 Tax=Armatimonas sp. TaxID=1872638 RepID=UPI00374FEB5A